MTDNEISQRHQLFPTSVPLAAWPEHEDRKYLIADEVAEMGKQLIDKFREDLRNYKIGYVFKEKAGKSGDYLVLGQAKSQPELQKVLHGYDGIVLIGFDMWKDLTVDQKYRLVLHELEHFELDDRKGGLRVVGHPVEEFPNVIRIFGPGNDMQIAFIEAYQKFSNDWNITLSDLKKEDQDS